MVGAPGSSRHLASNSSAVKVKVGASRNSNPDRIPRRCMSHIGLQYYVSLGACRFTDICQHFTGVKFRKYRCFTDM